MERSFCLLILISLNLLGADFIFSAQISTINHVLTYEDMSISKTMLKSTQDDIYLCTIDKKKPKSQTQYDYLLNHKDKLFECFLGQSIKVYDYSLYENTKSNLNTQLFLNPVRFRMICTQRNCKIYTFKIDLD